MTGHISSDKREEAYKLVITTAITFSVLSLLSLCIVLPAMYSFLQNVSAYSRKDLSFCDVTTRDLEFELLETREYMAKHAQNRSKRFEPSGGYGGPRVNAPPTFFSGPLGFQECPACCKPGPRGPPGDPGLPGMHGAPGPNGAAGRPGTTPNASCVPERVFEPPPCLPCPQGPRGQPGHPGFPGEAGDPGIPGRPGLNGDVGIRGPPGPEGYPGPRGPPGPEGDKGLTPEAHVISGPPGEPGDPGPWGLPGHAGQNGENGFSGVPGEAGWPGPPGLSGPVGPSGPIGPRGEIGPPGTPGTCVCQETEVIIEDIAAQRHATRRNGPRAPSPFGPGPVVPQRPGGFYQPPGPIGAPGPIAPPAPRVQPPAPRVQPPAPRAGYIRDASPEEKNMPEILPSGDSKADDGITHESNSGRLPPDVKILPDPAAQQRSWGRRN